MCKSYYSITELTGWFFTSDRSTEVRYVRPELYFLSCTGPTATMFSNQGYNI